MWWKTFNNVIDNGLFFSVSFLHRIKQCAITQVTPPTEHISKYSGTKIRPEWIHHPKMKILSF